MFDFAEFDSEHGRFTVTPVRPKRGRLVVGHQTSLPSTRQFGGGRMAVRLEARLRRRSLTGNGR